MKSLIRGILNQIKFRHISCLLSGRIFKSALKHKMWYLLNFLFKSTPGFSGKTVFITGATRGIGLELTKQFLSGGAKVFGTYRDSKTLDGLNKLKEKHQNLELIELDVLSKDSIEAVSSKVKADKIDILVNNAAVFGEKYDSLGELNLDSIKNTLEINSLGIINLTKKLYPLLKKGEGKVFNISSELGSISSINSFDHVEYSLSKALLNMFSKLFANMHREFVVLSIYPGWVKTDMGGDGAPFTSEFSCKKMLKVMGLSNSKVSGMFLNLFGKRMPE